ncbi:MAG: hypothetical protein RR355_06200, partial [Oscillospiraceae bacterium]
SQYARITLPENQALPSVQAFKKALDTAAALLSTKTLYLASYYPTDAQLQNLWNGLRMNIQLDKGLSAMRDAIKEEVRPGMGYPQISGTYTDETWFVMRILVDQIDNMKGSCTDAQGQAILEDFRVALENLTERPTKTTDEIALAKYNVATVTYPAYLKQFDRMILDTTKALPEYQAFKKLLDDIKAMLDSTTYETSVDPYNNVDAILGNGWNTARLKAPISAGLYPIRDAILATVLA